MRRGGELADVISIHDHLTNQILLSRSGKRYALHIRCIYALCVSAGRGAGHVQGTRRPRAHASLERQEAWTHEVGLKPEQLSAIDAILRGRDTFVSVPTGFGKSLVYQVLPFCADWLTGRVTGISTSSKPVVMVVSPLLSLMHDQVAKLASKNIRAHLYFWKTARC